MTKEEAKKLLHNPKTSYSRHKGIEKTAEDYCIGYKSFINDAKTERDAVRYAIDTATKNGFTPFSSKKAYKAGDKIYYNNRNKSIILAVAGVNAEAGANIIASHIDAPRIDLKQRALYEDSGISFFKTHYYGGIKKYQWSALPLALHGVIIKKDGTPLDICIGEDENDPVFYISDLMPHIGKDQFDRKLGEGILGEELNIINGSMPFEDDEDESVKLNILRILNEKYDITELDLINAELTAVPSQKTRDVGFDRSMIAAYAHDDRVCAYPSMTALFGLDKTPESTAVIILADKEEIGSYGVTGLTSDVLRHFLMDICVSRSVSYTNFIRNSTCMSADVGGAYDPTFSSAYEAKNSAYLAKGVVVTKYTGSRGKGGSSDASAELFGKITRCFDAAEVDWQTGEYGKVDQGGAGTVASEIAMMNIDVIDVGVPILSMHSPVELASKVDIYTMHLASAAFFALK
ncbi:MAG: aminopeptidase [Clostridiales bacterium GWF2_38_85]|nr:MAG: aminopeptidase [Clostridiales bacterium GWF2_38_85]HBL83814.1 aminopeptidase [Clostridiales bacterium]